MEGGSATYQVYVGVDVAAATFVAAWLAPDGTPTAPCTGEQTPAGFAALQRRRQATGRPSAATLVVLEATGNYWVALAVALHEAGYRVAVVNPRQAHHFAKAQLRRAKTDALDARDLAQRAVALNPAPWTPPPTVYHEVRQRLVARDALLDMRQQIRNQRHALLQWPVVVEGCASTSTSWSPGAPWAHRPADRRPGGRARGRAQGERVGGVAGLPDERAGDRPRHRLVAADRHAELRPVHRP